FTAFAVEVGALLADARDALLEQTWTTLSATARQQSETLWEATPEQRFLALLADGFPSNRAYLESLESDSPDEATSWGWERVTRHDQHGVASDALRRPPQGRLLGHLDADWLYLIPAATYQFVMMAAREANSVFPVDLDTLLKHLADGGMIHTQ